MNIQSLFKKVFSSREGSVIGIDVGTSAVKIVQIRTENGRPILETYGSLSLGQYADLATGQATNLPTDKIAQALKDVAQQSSISTNDAAIAVPSNASLIFTMSIPPGLSQKQITEIIPLEARKYIPVPITEVSLDWWILPDPTDDVSKKTDVLVVAIHNETMRRYQDMSRSMDLNTSFFEAEIFSSIRAAFFRELSATVLVDFGASKTKVAIIEYGLVRDFHIINKGSQDISAAIATALNVPFLKGEQTKREIGLHAEDKAVRDAIEFIIDYIISEISGFVLNYERVYGKLVTKVVISGGGSLLIGLPERMNQKLNLPVELSTPFDRLEAPKVLEPMLRRVGAEFAIAIGLALRKIQKD